MTHRSSDPRPGDRVQILIEDSSFHGVEGTVRNIYQDGPKLAVSIVVHVMDATPFIKANVPLAPDGGYHTFALLEEIDIIKRSLYS